MSFFGLTAFGPESLIQSSLVNSNGFSLYSNEEYNSSFEKIKKITNEELISSVNIPLMMEFTFGFKPLQDEVDLLLSHIKKFTKDSKFKWEEVKNGLESVRNDLNLKAEASKTYTSFEKYQYERFKHVRKEGYPSDAYKLPVSAGYEYGFHGFKERNLNKERFPINKCEETKFAEEIIKTGKHFMK